MIRILAIGNSFSQDATAWLYPLAASGGYDTQVCNLYIGGCSLETHWHNIEENAAAYEYEHNGQSTGQLVSIAQALAGQAWDHIVTQQVSYLSGQPESYAPWLPDLFRYVSERAPGAKRWLHQTWAYEPDSTHEGFARYGNDTQVMYDALYAAYRQAAQAYALPLLPCGEVVQRLRRHPAFDRAAGGPCLCRDGFHLDFAYGRYAAAAVWYTRIIGGSLETAAFLPEPDKMRPACVDTIDQVVREVCQNYNIQTL